MLRKFLKDAGVVLTDRKLPDEIPEAPKKTEDGKIPQPKDQSFLAPLRLDVNGKVCESVGSRAHDMGFAVGCHLEMEAPMGTLKQYVIKCLEQDRMILKGLDEQKAELEVTLDGMTNVNLLMPSEKNRETEIEPDSRMPGKPWELIAKADVDECLKYCVFTSMFHIHVQASPDFHMMRFHQAHGGEQYTLPNYLHS